MPWAWRICAMTRNAFSPWTTPTANSPLVIWRRGGAGGLCG